MRRSWAYAVLAEQSVELFASPWPADAFEFGSQRRHPFLGVSVGADVFHVIDGWAAEEFQRGAEGFCCCCCTLARQSSSKASILFDGGGRDELMFYSHCVPVRHIPSTNTSIGTLRSVVPLMTV